MIIMLMITTYLPILFIISAVTKAEHERIAKQQETIVNKNVNIIMNLNAKEVANELWKLMKNHLNNDTKNVISKENIIEDLENAVQPFVSPTRRGMAPLYANQVATDLDQIIRTTYIRNFPNMDMLDIEIRTRNIVANMMATLKIIFSRNLVQSQSDEMGSSSRRMLHISTNNGEQDDYVDIIIKIRKEDILNAL